MAVFILTKKLDVYPPSPSQLIVHGESEADARRNAHQFCHGEEWLDPKKVAARESKPSQGYIITAIS